MTLLKSKDFPRPKVFCVGKTCVGKRRSISSAKKNVRAANARAEDNSKQHYYLECAARVQKTKGRNQRNYTRGLFAWRVANNTASRIERTPLFGPAVPVPRGGSSAYDVVPRLRFSRLSEWAIFTQHADGRGRPQLIQAGFRSACVYGDCKRKSGRRGNSCASCWLGEHADELNIQAGMIFRLTEQSTFDQERVEDAAGVDPAGRKLGKTNAVLEIDAPHLQVTSTIRDYKKNNSVQQDPRTIQDLPATKDFRDEIR